MYKKIVQLIDINYGTFRGLIRSMLAQIEWVLGRVEGYTRLDAGQVRRLVFVCLGNINRSAFADEVAQSLGANTFSIGLSTQTGLPAFHKAVKTAAGLGVDLNMHRATDIKDYQFETGDLLLAMEIRHAKQLVASGIPEKSIVLLGYWATPRRIHLHDPHTLSDSYFKTCFTLINSAVSNIVDELRHANSPCIKP